MLGKIEGAVGIFVYCLQNKKPSKNDSVSEKEFKMPELKRPLDSSDSTALVVAKKPRNELVQVSEKDKSLVASVSLIERFLNLLVFQQPKM